MYPARRCSVLHRDLAAFCLASLGPAAKKEPAPRRFSLPASRYCHTGGGDGRSGKPQVKSRGSSSASVSSGPVCPMGSSRLFGTLAQTLSSAPLVQQDYYPEHQDPDQDPEGLEQANPDQLLRECEEALQNRPARPHRDLVYIADPTHQHQYRNHEQQNTPPIRVMTWNILAQALGEGKDVFVRCPQEALIWAERKYLILEQILTYRPDILCLQEVDHYYDTFQPILASLGYHSTFLSKPWSPCLDVASNNGPDGCALFYRRARFSLLSTSHLRLSAMMLPTNQVAIVQTLRCQETGQRLCVAVTHLKARSGWERLRGAQGADLLQSLKAITSGPAGSDPVSRGAGGGNGTEGVPLIVCGDFNAEPSEDVYKRFISSPLGLGSAYKLLSADGQTEPAFTTWKIRPSGESCSTLDYIWYSHDAFTVNTLLDIPTEEEIGPDRLPSYHYPSDHLSLLCDVSFR
ncbi:nocturnin isoform X1 [Coregonus clupeaformis]|uniref:nocturnin isoform X1 n=1 Tax=Coregonus clupeaformis TaxID=59861 RepID=UPI001BE0892B|nr:nocturnin isoform X1 [Coregonus clupeaformis]